MLASFDCAKATTAVEKTICASPRLSALDGELAATYAAARKLGGSAALRDEQRRWAAKSRDACGTSADCLEAAYLLRIAELRLAHREALFARRKAPAQIVGRYSEENDVIDIRRAAGNALTVTSELYFQKSHMCEFENAPGEWAGDELRVVLVEDSTPKCVLLLRFRGDLLTTVDPNSACKDVSCGARAGYHNVELRKKKR